MLDEAVRMTEKARKAREAFVRRHADKEGLERIEAMLVDLYSLMYVEWYVRPKE